MLEGGRKFVGSLAQISMAPAARMTSTNREVWNESEKLKTVSVAISCSSSARRFFGRVDTYGWTVASLVAIMDIEHGPESSSGYEPRRLPGQQVTEQASSSDANGSESQAKRRKILLTDANRAETYRHGSQPGRVPLHLISWHASNRGHQGIMPMHAHTVAENISTHGTSLRRYKEVKLVEVPDTARKAWLAANEAKLKHNPLLANFSAMSHNGTMYACLSCTHFVEAQKLILEGHRTHMDEPDGHALKLNAEDDEGNMIQSI